MNGRAKQQWWRVVIEWKLDSQDEGTRYAYITKAGYESTAIFAALNALIMPGAGVGATYTVISCDQHTRARGDKVDELIEGGANA
jgi:hypothetical protein